MPISISQSMMREIIMDHYSSPRHKQTPKNAAKYQQIHMDSTSCIDDIMVYVLVENDKVVDACFDGVACTIATAAADILCELIIDKTKAEANYILDQYENMIFEREFDEEVLDEALVFINTSKQAARIKCATIGCNGIKELIK